MSQRTSTPPPSDNAPRQDRPRRSRGERLRGLLREALFLGVLVLAVLSARSSFADHYFVPSESMLPTVEKGDHLVVNKLAYGLRVPFTETYLLRFDGPRRGDVVVLGSPINGETLLKRVAAVPGDQVEVRGGQLFLNDRPVQIDGDPDNMVEILGEVPHRIRLTHRGGPGFGPVEVPDDHYLVLGDNRGESLDGRSFGFVRRSAVMGKAVAIYWRGGLAWEPLN